MKLQRTTLILLLLALGLGGFVYFHEVRGDTQRQEAKAKEQQLFSFTADQVQSVTVKKPEQTLELEREGNINSSTADISIWQLKSPSVAPASDASVSYLMDLLVKGKSDRTLQVSAAQLQEYGLDRPQATIEVKLKNQQTHQIVLGKPDFNHSFLYAQADPPAKPSENANVLLVSTDFENAVNRPLSEWRAKDASQSSPSERPQSKASDRPSPSPSPSKDASQSSPSERPQSKASDRPSPSPSPSSNKSNTSNQPTPRKSDKPSSSPSP